MRIILAISLSTLILAPWTAHSKDDSIETRAQREFDKCEIATRRDRDQCNFGGCATIQRTCYDAKFDFLASKANSLSKNIKNFECLRLLTGFDEDMRKITERFDNAEILNSTWSGLEIKISAEAFRYNALSALNEECKQK